MSNKSIHDRRKIDNGVGGGGGVGLIFMYPCSYTRKTEHKYEPLIIHLPTVINLLSNVPVILTLCSRSETAFHRGITSTRKRSESIFPSIFGSPSLMRTSYYEPEVHAFCWHTMHKKLLYLLPKEIQLDKTAILVIYLHVQYECAHYQMLCENSFKPTITPETITRF